MGAELPGQCDNGSTGFVWGNFSEIDSTSEKPSAIEASPVGERPLDECVPAQESNVHISEAEDLEKEACIDGSEITEHDSEDDSAESLAAEADINLKKDGSHIIEEQKEDQNVDSHDMEHNENQNTGSNEGAAVMNNENGCNEAGTGACGISSEIEIIAVCNAPEDLNEAGTGACGISSEIEIIAVCNAPEDLARQQESLRGCIDFAEKGENSFIRSETNGVGNALKDLATQQDITRGCIDFAEKDENSSIITETNAVGNAPKDLASQQDSTWGCIAFAEKDDNSSIISETNAVGNAPKDLASQQDSTRGCIDFAEKDENSSIITETNAVGNAPKDLASQQDSSRGCIDFAEKDENSSISETNAAGNVPKDLASQQESTRGCIGLAEKIENSFIISETSAIGSSESDLMSEEARSEGLSEQASDLASGSHDEVSTSIAETTSSSDGPLCLHEMDVTTYANGNVPDGWSASEPPTRYQGILGPMPTTRSRVIYNYYFVRVPWYEDKQLRAEIKSKELELTECTQKRDFINAAIRLKKAARADLFEKLKEVQDTIQQYNNVANRKRMELQSSLPEQQIADLEYRIQHESITLDEEKQLLRDIKKLKAERKDTAVFGQGQQKVELEPLQENLESLEKQWAIAVKRESPIRSKLRALKTEIDNLRKEQLIADSARQDVFTAKQLLIEKMNNQNHEFYKSRNDLLAARDYARVRDKTALEEHCNSQVERVLSLWNGDDKFRKCYIKANERSTLRRFETLDGRSLGPDEEVPLISDETGIDTSFQNKISDQPSPVTKQDASLKTRKPIVGKPSTLVPSKAISVPGDSERESTAEAKKIHQSSEGVSPKTRALSRNLPNVSEDSISLESEKEIEEAKARKREEEMMKAKLAEERKKKLAERAQAKALLKAQRDAERKEKERERRARKKASAGASSTEKNTDESDSTVREEKSQESSAVASAAKEVKQASASTRRRAKQVRSETVVPVVMPPRRKGNALKIWTSVKRRMTSHNLALISCVTLLIALLALVLNSQHPISA